LHASVSVSLENPREISGDRGSRICCMQSMPEPLAVSPSELHLTADRIDGHGADFTATHQAACRQAGHVSLASGRAAAALPQMLHAWDGDGVQFGEHFSRHAHGHRNAATAYVQTDGDGADRIGHAGSVL